MRTLSGVGLFSTAILLFQVTLTRLFSIAQFYHFAFLVVSLALLGFGASGSLLAIWPRLRSQAWGPVSALGFAITTVIAYLILNRWSFDSYAIAWSQEQLWRLLLNLLALAVPFTFAGILIGALLAGEHLSAGHVYGANMIGSALGAMLAPLLLAGIGGERIILLCAVLATSAAFLLTARPQPYARILAVTGGLMLAGSVITLITLPAVFEIQPSPYKPLGYYRRNPDAALDPPRFNAYSRLDIVHSSSIHSAPGLSIGYLEPPPPEIGLLVDGDNLMPVVQASAAPPAFFQSMPASVALGLYQNPDVLILGVGGGLDTEIALANGAGAVVAVEPNGLIVNALTHDLAEWSGLASDPRVTLIHREIRTYVQQTGRRFDLVQLALTDAYRPVTSGAFTLTENYTLTVEAFRAYLDRLNGEGMLVVTRWLQNPPSEELRTLGLIVEALEARGGDPARQIVAFRSFQTVTFLVKVSPFTPEQVDRILSETERLKYDMILAPNLPLDTINRFAKLPEPVYYTTFNDLIQAKDRDAFYDQYAFDVRPPTDDHPFFFHFFKWSQTPKILNNLGRTWQPFGGSGYFVLVALLIFAVLAALLFVILPVALLSRFRKALRQAGTHRSTQVLVYFAALGLAYLLIEMSTVQQFVLILGQPTLAIAAVLATLLLFSGIGSLFSDRVPWGWTLAVLAVLVILWPWIMDRCAPILLALPMLLRLLLSVIVLAPLGLLMGFPFARGITAIRGEPDLAPWAWAINGGASVISAVLASLLALSFGFTWVLVTGGLLYGIAWLSRPDLNAV